MENEKIVLINFESISEGTSFMSGMSSPFSFQFSGQTYDHIGNLITTPDEFDLENLNDIYLDIHDNPSPGVLYVSDGFLKYFKEV